MCIRDSLDAEDKMSVVLQEILQDKIYLDDSDEVQVVGEDVAPTLPDINPLDL